MAGADPERERSLCGSDKVDGKLLLTISSHVFYSKLQTLALSHLEFGPAQYENTVDQLDSKEVQIFTILNRWHNKISATTPFDVNCLVQHLIKWQLGGYLEVGVWDSLRKCLDPSVMSEVDAKLSGTRSMKKTRGEQIFELDGRFKFDLAERVCTDKLKFTKLALALGFQQYEIDGLINNHKESIQLAGYYMLCSWDDRIGDTVEEKQVTLAAVLREVDAATIAKELATKYKDDLPVFQHELSKC